MRTIHLPYDITPLPIPRRSTRVGARAFFRKVSRWIALFRLDGELEMASGQAWAYERLARIGQDNLKLADAQDYGDELAAIDANLERKAEAVARIAVLQKRQRALESERNR